MSSGAARSAAKALRGAAFCCVSAVAEATEPFVDTRIMVRHAGQVLPDLIRRGGGQGRDRLLRAGRPDVPELPHSGRSCPAASLTAARMPT